MPVSKRKPAATAADQPAARGQPAAKEQPAARGQPAAKEQPAAKGQPAAKEQPAARNQPGIEHALRHGFYSRGFNNLEHSDLEAMLSQGLESEIAMLRVVVRRAFELTTSAAGEESQDLDRAIHVMNSLGMASIRLGSLLKVQAMLGKRQDDIGAVISEALREVARDLKL
jgi:hypothetical protein